MKKIRLSAHKEMLKYIVAALMQKKTQIQTKEMPCDVKVLTFINPIQWLITCKIPPRPLQTLKSEES